MDKSNNNENWNHGLSPQQKLFCAEYVKDFNATAAAKRAGYSPKSARFQASRLLTNVNIQKEFRRLYEELVEQVQHETGITKKRVMNELAKVAFMDAAEFTDEDGEVILVPAIQTRDMARAKIEALKPLGKELGMFVEKKEITTPDGKPIQIETTKKYDMSKLTKQELKQLRALSEKIYGYTGCFQGDE